MTIRIRRASNPNMSVELIKVKTSSREQLVDVTSDIRRVVEKSGVDEGVLILYVPHTTAAITINEGADPDVAMDITEGLAKIAPYGAGWRHAEGNADSHVKCSLISPSISVIIEKGDIVLGTWQRVFFCEFDGPRSRKLLAKIIKG